MEKGPTRVGSVALVNYPVLVRPYYQSASANAAPYLIKFYLSLRQPVQRSNPHTHCCAVGMPIRTTLVQNCKNHLLYIGILWDYHCFVVLFFILYMKQQFSRLVPLKLLSSI